MKFEKAHGFELNDHMNDGMKVCKHGAILLYKVLYEDLSGLHNRILNEFHYDNNETVANWRAQVSRLTSKLEFK